MAKFLVGGHERPAIGKETLEIPAGKLEYGENPMECGLRELNEETGMACDKLELLLSFVSTPGFCDERIWIYKAINPRKADIKLSLDEDEEIDTFVATGVYRYNSLLGPGQQTGHGKRNCS